MNIKTVDARLISFFRRWSMPVARASIFVVYFWFGALKLFELSPAGPLASALVDKTVGAAYFDGLYVILALFECLIGLLFLFPKATRVVIPLLLLHLIIVCSPLLLVPGLAWQGFLIPTLEGQYIIKNVVIAALAITVAAQTRPLAKRKAASS